MHAPQRPEGLLPVVIQSLFINCKIFNAVFSTSFELLPKLNLLKNNFYWRLKFKKNKIILIGDYIILKMEMS